MALFNRQGKAVKLETNYQFGVDYNPTSNEMEGHPVKLREFDFQRRDLRESKSPLPFPKGNMFNIEQRVRVRA